VREASRGTELNLCTSEKRMCCSQDKAHHENDPQQPGSSRVLDVIRTERLT